RGDRLRGMVGDGRVDVDGVHVRVFEQLVEAGVPLGDAVAVADFVQLGLVAATDGVHLGVRVGLVDRDELGPEPQPDDRHANVVGQRWCAPGAGPGGRDSERVPKRRAVATGRGAESASPGSGTMITPRTTPPADPAWI